MAVHWECGETSAHKHAIAAAKKSGEFDHTVPTWDIYCNLREALIWALLVTGFPNRSNWAITESNWEDLYTRLYIHERVNGCCRVYDNGVHNVREVYFQPEEIHSMIGMSVNAGSKTDAEFKKYIFKKLEEFGESRLDYYKTHLDDDDPYAFERKHGKPRKS